MNILVCVDRNWADYAMIRTALWNIAITMPDEYPSTFVRVINGAARGADRLSSYAAKSLGLGLKESPADWIKYSKAAGPIRNQQMLDEDPIDLVLAFHDEIDWNDLENAKGGTADMVRKAKKAGIKI